MEVRAAEESEIGALVRQAAAFDGGMARERSTLGARFPWMTKQSLLARMSFILTALIVIGAVAVAALAAA